MLALSISAAPILAACGIIAAVSVVVGIALNLLADKFKVEVDPREAKLREALGGSNCGACGYSGCDAYAHAVVCEGADANLCSAADAKAVEQILGVKIDGKEKMTAYVHCSGNCSRSAENYNFVDTHDCRIAYLAPGHGSKKCAYGCCGFGTCAEFCPYGAITVFDGLAVINEEKCRACGICVNVCPNQLIDLIPASAKYVVRCSSKDKGQSVKKSCAYGCIGCGLCMRVCESGAIRIENNIAKIDYEKCTGCGKCAEKCPSKIIIKRS